MISGYTKTHLLSVGMTDLEINNSIHDCMYDFYFPKSFFIELVNLCNYQMFDKDYRKGMISYGIFNNPDIISLLNTIDFEFYCAFKHPASHIALHILSDLQKDIDFRLLETNIVSKVENKLSNEINEVSEEFLDVYKDTTYSTEDLKYILKIYNIVSNKLFKGVNKVTGVKRTRLTKVSDIFKIKKSSMAKPLFMLDVLSKKLIFDNKIDIPKNEEKTIVYLEDASKSMFKGKGHLTSRAIQQLLIDTDISVDYFRYYKNTHEFKKLKTTKDKVNGFNKNHVHYEGVCDYSLLLNEIETRYTNEEILIVTDGKDTAPLKIDSDVKINCVDVSGSNNYRWKLLCKSTRGRYLNL